MKTIEEFRKGLSANANDFDGIVSAILERQKELEGAVKLMRTTLHEVRMMNEYAIPKFNWGTSCLDAKAITLLNETPALVVLTLVETADI